MKKMKQKFLASAIALSALASTAVIPAANAAEVSASVGASNMYYWRGFDLLGGAALIGDVNVSSNGFFAGLWASSGDEVLGSEYDIYAGYSGEAGDFSYGVSFVSYNYANPSAGIEPVSPGDYVEVVPFLGYGPFKVTYYDAINADHDSFSEDYSYVTAELNFDKFGIKYGQHMLKDGGSGSMDGVAHIDLTYKFNDKLSFTLGQIVDDNDFANDETNFVVTLSLPIE
ncbi:TorF family putative porin [Cellvibrio sp. ARAG 10.3]|uniref:TorF family putative porin n=1 Tax=Cellvibrio sp. ARAG 10.3 TaxID=3451358 RepID=UPI003F465700